MKIFLHYNPKNILESHVPESAPRILDEIDDLANTIDANMALDVKIPKDVLDSFQIKDTLNQDIWNGDKLNSKVRAKLIRVATSFYKDLDLPKEAELKDIIFTGSLANFNWSKFSDIDLHLVLDFRELESSYKLAEDYFYAQKSLWNQEHDIDIYGFPIEIYVQDIRAKLVATAVYSVLQDDWVKKPTRENFSIDKKAVKEKAMTIIDKLRDIRKDYKDKEYQDVVDKVKRLKDKIKQMRNSGLERGGEFSLENIVFKVLRRTPFMDILDSFKAKAYDTLMSITSEPIDEENEMSPKATRKKIKVDLEKKLHRRISDNEFEAYLKTGIKPKSKEVLSLTPKRAAEINFRTQEIEKLKELKQAELMGRRKFGM
jgi:hypothetical protein